MLLPPQNISAYYVGSVGVLESILIGNREQNPDVNIQLFKSPDLYILHLSKAIVNNS